MTKKMTALFLMTLIVAALAAFGCAPKKTESSTESSSTTTTGTSTSTSMTDTASTMTAPADTAASH